MKIKALSLFGVMALVLMKRASSSPPPAASFSHPAGGGSDGGGVATRTPNSSNPSENLRTNTRSTQVDCSEKAIRIYRFCIDGDHEGVSLFFNEERSNSRQSDA